MLQLLVPLTSLQLPPYFPGPAEVYASRMQSMTLPQLINVLQSISNFIQVKQWGPQNIIDLRNKLIKEAWHPLTGSGATWDRPELLLRRPGEEGPGLGVWRPRGGRAQGSRS